MWREAQGKSMRDRHSCSVGRRLACLALMTFCLWPWAGNPVLSAGPPETPTAEAGQVATMPEIDRLAEPVLPESPTQVDVGRNLYYFNCMPCHGDQGQGLTDEWREVWVEDHQNCWSVRGCHTGNPDIGAFYIPRTIPAVIGSPPVLGAFQTADKLFAFLRATQPPQRAGALSDEEYWALTSFLLHENGLPVPAIGASSSGAGLAIALLAPLLALVAVTWLAGRPRGLVSQAASRDRAANH